MKTSSAIAVRLDIDKSPIACQFVHSNNRRSGTTMEILLLGKAAIFSALIVAGLTAGLGIGTVHAASGDAVMAPTHSDSVGAAISDSAITAKVKAKLFDTASRHP